MPMPVRARATTLVMEAFSQSLSMMNTNTQPTSRPTKAEPLSKAEKPASLPSATLSMIKSITTGREAIITAG